MGDIFEIAGLDNSLIEFANNKCLQDNSNQLKNKNVSMKMNI